MRALPITKFKKGLTGLPRCQDRLLEPMATDKRSNKTDPLLSQLLNLFLGLYAINAALRT